MQMTPLELLQRCTAPPRPMAPDVYAQRSELQALLRLRYRPKRMYNSSIALEELQARLALLERFFVPIATVLLELEHKAGRPGELDALCAEIDALRVGLELHRATTASR